MTVLISPLQKLRFVDAAGIALAGGKVFTYAAGTTNKLATYIDATGGTPNTNPILLDSRGECSCWLTPGMAYKFTLSPATDTDPPTNPIWTVDNVLGIDDLTGVAMLVNLAASSPPTGASLIGFKQPLLGAATRTVQTKGQDFVTLADFANVVGNGSNDDTAGINAALASGARVVYGIPGATYLVSSTGSKTINGVATFYCLQIPAGVTLDLQGATVKLANGANASLFINTDAGTSQDADVGIRNGVIDGNKANQTVPASGDMAGILLYNCLRPRIEGLRFQNMRMYAGRFLKVDRGYWNNLYCTDSDGDGFSFGIAASSQEITNSFIDNIRADSCTGVFTGGSLVGNPMIFTIQYCQIGKVYGKDCNGGIKCQDTSSDSTFAEVLYRGLNNGSANSGFKVQGNGAGLAPARISAALVVSENAYGSGLYMAFCTDVSVGEYIGINNSRGLSAGTRDVELQTGTDRISIGSIISATCKNTQAIVNAGNGRAQFGRIFIYNPTLAACQFTGTGLNDIDDLVVIDDGGGTTTNVLNVSGLTKGRCRNIYTNLANSTTSPRVTIAAGNYDYTIGSFQMGTAAQENIVQLTNAGTTTAVANDSIMRVFVGGSSDYFHPIIQLLPISSTAALLGNMRASVTDSSAGTGFTINHATAGASDKVMWKILGWKVISAPFA